MILWLKIELKYIKLITGKSEDGVLNGNKMFYISYIFWEIKGVEMYLNINVVSMQIPISRVITKGIEKVCYQLSREKINPLDVSSVICFHTSK